MGTITNTTINAAITHVSGVPANCAVVQAVTMDMGVASTLVVGGQSARAFKATGGLSGTGSLTNVAGGIDYGYAPVVLDGFSPPQDINIWKPPGSIFPDLSFADPTSLVIYNGSVVTSLWNSGDSAVSALLMHDNIINEFVLDSTTLSDTDWVITMPTKRYNVPVHNKALAIDATQLFSPFTSKFWNKGACEQISDFNGFIPNSPESWNREGNYITIVDFREPAPGGGASLCWATTVAAIRIDTLRGYAITGLLGSVNLPNAFYGQSFIVFFENGWLRMTFGASDSSVVNGQIDDNDVTHSAAAQSLTSINGETYFGLPIVGFMVQNFINQNAAPGVLATYGGNFNHKYTTRISRFTP